MKKHRLPSYVNKIMTLFLQKGFAAYIVGGAVRDLCRGKLPADYDIATDAYPEDIVRIAESKSIKVVPNLGQNFGVVLLYIKGKTVEVATFRGEKYGEDSHRPESVHFVRQLEDDLSRRDFTVNAMAMDIDGNITDIFGGLDDIKAKILRTVGNACERFGEDGLRMFRVARFCAQLGFTADKDMIAAIRESLYRAEGLSLERVKQELGKLLVSSKASAGLAMLKQSGLYSVEVKAKIDSECIKIPVLPELDEISSWREIDKLPKSIALRWAFLLKGQPVESVLKRLMYGRKFIKRVKWLSENIEVCLQMKKENINSWVMEEAASGQFYDRSEMLQAIKELGQICSIYGEMDDMFSEVIACTREMPVHTKDLMVTGEYAARKVPKEDVGPLLQELLQKVQNGEIKNDEQELMKYIDGINS